MSKQDQTVDKDLAGRVMALEQRLKGLQGRTAALEVRLSSPQSGGDAGVAVPDEDFQPATAYIDLSGSVSHASGCASGTAHDSDEAVPGLKQSPSGGTSRRPRPRAIDVTGLLAGATLVGAGFLLFTGELSLLKNPWLATGCGILLIGSALLRAIL